MIVRCIDATGLNEPGLSRCGLTAGHTYVVYGIGVRKLDAITYFSASGLAYLIASDRDKPHFFDASRFDVVDGALPPSWTFAFLNGSRMTSAAAAHPGRLEGAAEGMLGYPELVQGHAHYIGINLGREEDLQIFSMRRREIDLELSCPQHAN